MTYITKRAPHNLMGGRQCCQQTKIWLSWVNIAFGSTLGHCWKANWIKAKGMGSLLTDTLWAFVSVSLTSCREVTQQGAIPDPNACMPLTRTDSVLGSCTYLATSKTAGKLRFSLFIYTFYFNCRHHVKPLPPTHTQKAELDQPRKAEVHFV